ncbi:hypothetical protein DSO57_1001277, partial [Entomophthora muscae]
LEGKAGAHLDVFKVSKAFSQHFSQPEVLCSYLSDHIPVICYFDLAPPELPACAFLIK